jgi:hypothetical protein
MSETRKRSSRFERSAERDRVVLNERDVEIILAAYSHRWLSREQLRHLVALPNVGRTNDRLRKLWNAGLLQRLRAGTVGFGLQPIYAADLASVELIAAHSGISEEQVRLRIREDARASAILLPHDLEVNDLRIALTLAIRSRPDLGLDLWHNAAECFDAYAPGAALRPDGYFRVWSADLLHAYFVEVDRGTTDLSRWQQKVARYRDYRESGRYTEVYGLQRFRVLVTAPAPGRLAHLRSATRAVTDRGFWFALTHEVLEHPDPDCPIWPPVVREERRGLLEG